jgi:hypothetical protein
MGCQGRLRPVVQDALCGHWHELLCAFADQADHLRACVVIQSAPGKNLRHLLAELTVAF